MKESKAIEFLGDYINGQFLKPKTADGEFLNLSPADLSDRIMQIQYQYDRVDEACAAAKKAYLPWAKLTLDQRKNYLIKLKSVYEAHALELAEIISRDTGKPLWEAKTEVQAMVGKITITIEHSAKRVETVREENALPGIDGYVRFKSRGVMAVVGPFNFPGHLPNGHIIPALLVGNTVVFKPSEQTPNVGQWMAQAFDKAEFPPGVFNMVQGVGETGRRLVKCENVDGVLFTGSYEVGLKIKQETINHFWKILALEMGGKNATVVWNDADLDKAVYESLIGCFMTTGQRCSCTSRLILHHDIADKFMDRFYAGAKKLQIGHWSENPFMGPLINKDAVEKYLRFQEIAKRENCEPLMRGKVLKLNQDGYYVTPSINLVGKFDEKSIYQNNEIFGPNVAVYRVSDFDEAIQINNSSGFGLVMALFSHKQELFDEAILKARVGLLNWNRTTNGASSKLPFGGVGKSGNDRPSADFAIDYCSVPVASLQDTTPFDATKVLPGMNYDG